MIQLVDKPCQSKLPNYSWVTIDVLSSIPPYCFSAKGHYAKDELSWPCAHLFVSSIITPVIVRNKRNHSTSYQVQENIWKRKRFRYEAVDCSPRSRSQPPGIWCPDGWISFARLVCSFDAFAPYEKIRAGSSVVHCKIRISRGIP